jgi:hypothetical protein
LTSLITKGCRRRRLKIRPTLTFGPGGDLFVSSAATSEVKRFDGTTGAFRGKFVTAGLGGLEEAEGVIFGPNGNLFVASELGNAVQEYNGTTGAFVGAFVPNGSGGLANADLPKFGPAVSAIPLPPAALSGLPMIGALGPPYEPGALGDGGRIEGGVWRAAH